MDEILTKKPVAQLDKAATALKTYVLLLEENLISCIGMLNLNKELELKFKKQRNELCSLQSKNKEFIRNKDLQNKEIQKLRTDKVILETENMQLKQFVEMLQNRTDEQKNNYRSSGNSVTNSKRVEVIQKKVNDNDANPDANSVFIKGFNEQQLPPFPGIYVINLARRMDLKLTDKDIVSVSKMERKFYKRHNMKPENTLLIVKFRTCDIKVEFLKNKAKLKDNGSLCDIEITDYVSDEVYNLYQYAKILKTFGYAQIYWRNNCVYVKSTRSTYCEPILIKSKSDVDGLKVNLK